jgi:hypothetical protein
MKKKYMTAVFMGMLFLSTAHATEVTSIQVKDESAKELYAAIEKAGVKVSGYRGVDYVQVSHIACVKAYQALGEQPTYTCTLQPANNNN